MNTENIYYLGFKEISELYDFFNGYIGYVELCDRNRKIVDGIQSIEHELEVKDAVFMVYANMKNAMMSFMDIPDEDDGMSISIEDLAKHYRERGL